MRLTVQIFTYLFSGVILLGLIGGMGSMISFSEEDAVTSAGLPINSVQHIPQAGNTVSCEDGSVYTIKDVSQYQRTPAEPAFAEFLADALSASIPDADAIHFADVSGDYLFVKNRYEMYRILCTLNQPTTIQLSIPEDAIPIVLDSWDPEWMAEFQNSHSNKICCLESWDMYKNGVYLKTVYLAAAI